MSFKKGSNAPMPMELLFGNGYGVSFADPDTPVASIHPEAAAAVAGSGVIETGSVDHGLGFGLDPTASNDISTNPEFLNDLYFSSVAGEDGAFLSEDIAMANSFSWDIGMDSGKPYPSEGFPDTTDHREQGRIFDIAVLPDQAGPPLVESQTLRRAMGNNLGFVDFQPLLQAQHKFGGPSSTSQAWKQNLISNPDTAKTSNHLSKSNSPLSEQQQEETYIQLEFFYRFKPHLTQSQLQALAVVVELSYDEVQAFYRQKKSQPPSCVSNSSRSRHGQGPRLSHPAKRSRGSDTSSSPEPVHSAYGLSRSDSSASLQISERSAIPRTPSLNRQVREPSQKQYECTWRDCSMSFASKSDWKRHEEVHCPQWEWTCTFENRPARKSSGAIPCARLPFKRSDHLREHLRKDHKCADLSKVEAGRQCIIPQNPFNKQCGFCGYITKSWLDRIDHIADHFKKGSTMSEWTGPWSDDVFEEESDSSNDDGDNGNGNADGTDNNNSTSQDQDHAGNDFGNDNRKDVNMNLRSGGYQGSGSGYRRPGTLAIRYHASSRGMDATENIQRRDNASLRHELHSPSSFWSKMRNMLKNRNSQKETSSAPPLQATKAPTFESSHDSARQDKERIEFYCILCLKRVSTDPSIPNSDAYHCACSEAAIKEHIMSVALAGVRLDAPSTKSLEEGTPSEQKTKEREKTAKSPAESSLENAPKYLLTSLREQELARKKPQRRASFDELEEQLSYSTQHWLKSLPPASESLSEYNQDENSWVKIHPQDLAGLQPDKFTEPHSSSSQQDILVPSISGKLAQTMGSNCILHKQSLPELRRRRYDGLVSRKEIQRVRRMSYRSVGLSDCDE